jgi:hypothetical protein
LQNKTIEVCTIIACKQRETTQMKTRMTTFPSTPRTRAWRAAVSLSVAALLAAIGPTAFAQRAVEQPGKTCDTATTPFCDATMAPVPGWKGRVFRLAQHYPASAPKDVQPWLSFDPHRKPQEYLDAVLAYFYEGNTRSNTEASFDPALNRVRGWYNAPWQDRGTNGREFVHGLTRERVSLPGELDPKQTLPWNNYAVGFYNAPGGVTLGKVWANHGNPDAGLATMPEGTVAAKLLFTTAPVEQVPWLAGSPEWQAYVYDPNDSHPRATSPRAIRTVRLLQVDIAVKDRRATDTGWVFGTFVYGGGPGRKAKGGSGSGWQNVSPVGVMWGNDPDYKPGHGELQQTALNPAVHMPHLGYQGRLNGPVDNAVSSCMSCHSTAELPQGTMVPPKGADPAPWFRNIESGVPFDAGHKPLDYSLQLEVGLVNFLRQNPSVFPRSLSAAQVERVHQDIGKPLSRAGDE